MRTTATTFCVLLVTLGFWAGETRAQVDATIQFTNDPPIIDGIGLDEPAWEGVTEHGMDEFFTVVGAEPEDETDLSATWRALWDQDNLYVLIEVLDVEVFNTTDCNWDDDSVEIYIDAQDINSENFEFANNAPDGVPAYQFTAIAGDKAGGPYCRAPATENDETAFTLGINSYDDGGDPDSTRYPQNMGVSNGSVDGGVFYTFEVAFPWEALEESTENILARGSFGFGVAVNDDDFDGSRETQVMWASESPDLWMRSDVFPSVALEPPPLDWPGDANGDGHTDVDDLNILALNWQQSVTGGIPDADFDENGTVDVADLNVIGTNWQTWDPNAPMPASVPEPSSVALLLAGLLAVNVCRRKRS